MCLTITARELQPGHIIDSVEGNPNIRGTVTDVHTFCNPAAALVSCHQPLKLHKPKGEGNYRPESRVLGIRTPPSVEEARTVAHEVETCYTEDHPSSVAVRVAARNVVLRPDQRVNVWITATDAARMFAGKVA